MKLPVSKCILLLFSVIFFLHKGYNQDISFTKIPSGIPYVNEPVVIGDIDRDLDYDIFIGGLLYLNNAGTFSYYTTVGELIYSTDLGDYDNDNDLDIAQGGDPIDGDGGTIYENNGLSFQFNSYINSYFYSDIKFIDVDNDGDLDLYCNGYFSLVGGTNIASELYEVENSTFSSVEQDIPPVYYSGIEVVDFNHDSYNDMIITGQDGFGNSNTFIAENLQNKNFSVDYGIQLPGIHSGGTICEDFNNNGNLDIFLFGAALGNQPKLYLNLGNAFIEFLYDFRSVYSVKCDAGDLNHDGKLDIVLSGIRNLDLQHETWVFLSEAFSYESMVFTSSASMAKLIDYDDDNDLDIFQGDTILVNNITITNNNPQPPVYCDARTTVGGVKLYWNRATDDISPVKSLKYNIRVGTTSSGNEIRSASAHSSGKTYLPYGNFIRDTFLIINDLAAGVYYWSVQTIDQSRAASYFSPVYTFTVPAKAFSKHTELGQTWSQGFSQKWADTDNDKDYDLVLISNRTFNTAEATIQYYENIEDTLTANTTYFADYRNGEACFADLNNDNIADFILTGKENDTIYKTAVYLGNNDTYSLITDSLEGFTGGTVLCADFNNNGKSDIFISGVDTSGDDNAYILRNNLPLSFDILPVNVPGMTIRKAGAADIDKDNDIDLVVSGHKTYDSSPLTTILINNGDYDFQSLKEIPLFGEVRIADMNKNDSSDIVIHGADLYGNGWCKVYYNNELNFDIMTQLSAFGDGSLELGDYNNNGYYDILISGYGVTKRTVFYDNINGTEFVEQDYLKGHGNISSYSDFDGDGDLDVIISGNFPSQTSYETNINQNNLNVENMPPDAPTGLSYSQQEFDIILSWNAAYDDKTSKGLSYNVRIGSTSVSCDIKSPLSNLDDGFRIIQAQGNAGCNTSWTIKELPEGTYYWSIQAVDQSFRGSEWANQRSFNVSRAFVDFDADTVCLGYPTIFTNKSSLMTDTIITYGWDFGDGGTSNQENPVHTYVSADTFEVTLTLYIGSEEFSKVKEVIVKPLPEAGFTYDYITTGGDVLSFENTSDTAGLEVSEWLWDFGDSIYHEGKNAPQHAYTSTGTYTIQLKIISSNGCVDSTYQDVMICEEFMENPGLYVFGPNVWYFACSNDSALYYRWYLNSNIIDDANSFIYVANQVTGEYYVEISNDNVCYFASDRITIPDGYAIAEEVELFPVPASGRVMVKINNVISDKYEIVIYNSYGTIVDHINFIKDNFPGIKEFDISDYKTGIYFIEVRFDNRKITKKIIINKQN
jgi:hypothetical protein